MTIATGQMWASQHEQVKRPFIIQQSMSTYIQIKWVGTNEREIYTLRTFIQLVLYFKFAVVQ